MPQRILSDIVSVNGAVLSKIGGRAENQDDFDFVDTPVGFLVILCDGMGGGPGGKTASYIAKYEIAAALGECNSQTPREQAFRAAVGRANAVLEKRMEEMPSLRGMGSTFVAILINKYSAVVAHAGDSRCYQLRDKKCIYRSTDHSLVSELVKSKALTEEEARKSPQSNVISRGLGSVGNNVPEIEEIPYKKGDRFVLCTDGVWGIMPNKDLLSRFVTPANDPVALVKNISEEVDNIGFSKGGGHDNHTLALVVMGEDSVMKSAPDFNYWIKVLLIACVGIALVIGVSKYVKDNYFGKDNNSLSDNGNTVTENSLAENAENQNNGTVSIDGLDGLDILDNLAVEDDAHRGGKDNSAGGTQERTVEDKVAYQNTEEQKNAATDNSGIKPEGENKDSSDAADEPILVTLNNLIKTLGEFEQMSCDDYTKALEIRNSYYEEIQGYLKKLYNKREKFSINTGKKIQEYINEDCGSYKIEQKNGKYILLENTRKNIKEKRKLFQKEKDKLNKN